MKVLKKLSLAAFALAFLAGRADAGLIPQTVQTSTVGGNTTYTFGIVLQSNSTLKSGDYFTIYDFQGSISGNTQPAGWALTVQNTGTTPPGVSPTDSSSIPNLTWTYTGATVSGSASASLGLGNFTINSTVASNSGNTFAGQSSLSDGTSESNVTQTPTPNGGSNPSGGGPAGGGPGLPEPVSLLLAAIGLPLAGLVGGLRRRAST